MKAIQFLNLFCSGSEQESLIGDLIEESKVRGTFWLWRQVLGIVLLRLYHEPEIFLRPFFTVVFVGFVLAAVMLSDIAVILLVPIVAGLLVGVLKFGFEAGRAGPVPNAPAIARIDSSKIPIYGGAWAGVVIAVLLTGVLIDLPVLRVLAAPGIVIGLLLAVYLHHRRRNHPPQLPLIKLNL